MSKTDRNAFDAMDFLGFLAYYGPPENSYKRCRKANAEHSASLVRRLDYIASVEFYFECVFGDEHPLSFNEFMVDYERWFEKERKNVETMRLARNYISVSPRLH